MYINEIQDKETEKKINRAKYLSNSITITKNHVVPSLFTRYYSWLTNNFNLYCTTIGVAVKAFSVFGSSEINPHVLTQKGLYVRTLESIAYGIIKSTTRDESLSIRDYIKYQNLAFQKLFNRSFDFNDKDMMENYWSLFEIQDLDNDNKLGIRDLTVSLAYLDSQDGVLNGKLRYEDAINLGADIDSDVGKFRMKLELNHLKELLYT